MVIACLAATLRGACSSDVGCIAETSARVGIKYAFVLAWCNTPNGRYDHMAMLSIGSTTHAWTGKTAAACSIIGRLVFQVEGCARRVR